MTFTSWRRSSFSGDTGNCVEMPVEKNALRDSKHKKAVLPVAVAGVNSLIAFIRAGEAGTPTAR